MTARKFHLADLRKRTGIAVNVSAASLQYNVLNSTCIVKQDAHDCFARPGAGANRISQQLVYQCHYLERKVTEHA
ncbi:hypothetical protein [Paraburkholderia ribeironis]|uniref:hypothetical protein n=1 Tax=Paraburkholderia ribeironis TaxID=1247936 RepID=UPI001356323C|nr:hypothetical protein [Paraburkholderia ribeironis]